ncbi:peptidoglycan-binding protein [Stenotrophomonas maltophilia]|uniref:peptidoglycan-binding protein n=1 Tax=Stenotrophomonas TaxID=40323 RepID=UPI0006C2E4F9|nr:MULTISPECIES: peptidoglycan-binding protein [Stenotrophomonas]KAA3599045.1 peptidoglycan-binding protein [Stenotrophomonas maltophilia]KOO79492.1 peptidoglycan-binding protein [Stenotrophomonas maltophilia]MBN5124535.1 peptidoglycan-binding protein [Stenotrophomonas maltophilia]MBN5175339.1 peptidoglycan-binding protein [Stenotrophomonas maltophilia]MCU1122387.1 peptidoglycan-binding protein [Stenotrophomonas maltophilia]
MSEGYGKGGSGFGLTRDQSVEMIVRTCIDNGITDHRQIAYVLATAQHESRDFAAPEEDWGRKQAVDLRYFGGEEYFGRGFAHLTHVNNYERLGEALGMGRELVEHPERAAQAEIATKVLVVGMRDGMFGARLSDHVNANHADYRQARASVNGGELNNGSPYPDAIAARATEWESQVAGLVQRVQQPDFQMPVPTLQAPAGAMDLHRGDANQQVLEAQQYLQRLDIRNNANAAIKPDGDFGASTEQAVRRFQTERGIDPADGRIDDALLERMRSDTLAVDPDFKRRTVTDLTGPLADGNLGPGEKGEPVFEMRRQLEALGYLTEPNPRAERDARTFDAGMQAAMRNFQQDYGLPLRPGGVIDADARRQLNDAAVAREHAPTTEFDRAENWPPQRPPYTRAEFQPEQVRARQQAAANPPVAGPAAPEPAPQPNGVESLSPRDAALFERIRQGVPGTIGDEHVMQAVLESKRNGIDDAARVDRVMMAGDRLWVAGLIPGERASVDTAQPARSMEESVNDLAGDNRQREHQLALESRQHENRGPSMA